MILKKSSNLGAWLHLAKIYAIIWLEKRARTKRKYDFTDLGFLALLALSVSALLYMISELSISYKELDKLYSSDSWLFAWLRLCVEVFGANDYALRGSFVLLHALNMLLMYSIGRIYLSKPNDSLFLALIYALIPGVNISALMLYESGFILFVLLLICYMQLRFRYIPYVMIFVAGCFDLVFCVLFVALGIYALIHRKTKTLIASLIGFGVNMFLYSSSIGGVPSAHFLDVLGSMAMLFSPLLFLYYVYTLYAALARRKEDSMMALISASGLVLCLLLSLRQEIDIISFAPLCVVGLPVLVFGFFSDMRVRLKAYRGRFKLRMFFVFSVLCLETFGIYGNKISYIFSPKPNFAYPYYIAKDVANELKARGIDSLKVQDSRLSFRLGFYGIGAGNNICLYSNALDTSADKANRQNATQNPPQNTPARQNPAQNSARKNASSENIDIVYLGRIVASFRLVRSNACRI